MFPNITHDPSIMAGRACIRGMRIPVSLVVNLCASGMSRDEIIAEYPDLTEADIIQALRYSAALAEDEVRLSDLVPA